MSAPRTRPIVAASTCANPLCAEPIAQDQPDAIELAQVQHHSCAEPLRASWTLCGLRCAVRYLELCDAKGRRADLEHAEGLHELEAGR